VTVALGLLVVLLGCVGAWRLRVVSQDVALLDRDLGNVHKQMGRAHEVRDEIAQRSEQRHRTTAAVTSQLHGEVAGLRRRVDAMEPWLRMWATPENRQ
jgi:hypothetical protein